MATFPFGDLQLKDLTKFDAIIIQAMISKKVHDESDINKDWVHHSAVAKSLRTANSTAISIMANIFY